MVPEAKRSGRGEGSLGRGRAEGGPNAERGFQADSSSVVLRWTDNTSSVATSLSDGERS